jgi:hypothetical protein
MRGLIERALQATLDAANEQMRAAGITPSTPDDIRRARRARKRGGPCESRCGRSDDDRQVCFRNAVASDGNPARGRTPDVHQIQILFADHHETVQAFNPRWVSNAKLSTSTSGRGEREPSRRQSYTPPRWRAVRRTSHILPNQVRCGMASTPRAFGALRVLASRSSDAGMKLHNRQARELQVARSLHHVCANQSRKRGGPHGDSG